VKEWLAASGVQTLPIEPGSPWENAYVESFNGKLEDELLGRELFTSLTEAKVRVEQYRLEYNHERPHSSLDYQTPAEFAASCDRVNVASAAGAATAFDHPPVEGTGEVTSGTALSY
jgi:putative transposase